MELDHVFVFVPPGGGALRQAFADRGFSETYERAHPGQGTANVCYAFDNAFVELLWLTDPVEAGSEAIRRTGLLERSRWETRPGVCRFGIAYRTVQPPAFRTWSYTPPYLPPGMAIAVAAFSDDPTLPMVFQSPGRVPPTAWPLERQRGLQRAAGLQTLQVGLQPVQRELPEGLRSLDGSVIELLSPGTEWRVVLRITTEEGALLEVPLA
jgi:hypothetical protein